MLHGNKEELYNRGDPYLDHSGSFSKSRHTQQPIRFNMEVVTVQESLGESPHSRTFEKKKRMPSLYNNNSLPLPPNRQRKPIRWEQTYTRYPRTERMDLERFSQMGGPPRPPGEML